MSQRLCLLIVFVLVVCARAAVRADAGSIVGTVTAGPQSAPITHARVWLRARGRQQSTQTDVDGHFQFGALTAGTSYTLTFEGDGLRTARQIQCPLRVRF